MEIKMDSILRIGQLVEKIGLSRSSILRMEKEGEFPKKIILSKRVIGWLESDVNDWLMQQAGRNTGNKKVGK
jgi:prophage regulatory protein